MQLEHPRKQYRKQVFTQLLAFMLLSLFVSAIVIEGLHHHHDQFTSCKTKVTAHHDGQELHIAKVTCKLCEVIKQQSHFYLVPEPVVQQVYINETTPITFAYITQHPDAYIHAATNKGPPSYAV